MPSTPDPSYWGNPPKTPVSKYAQQPASAQNGQAGPSATPVPPAPPAPPSDPKKSNKGVIIAIIAVIVVLLLGMAGCSACTVAITSGADNYLADSSSSQRNTPYGNGQNNSSSNSESDQAYLNAQTRSAFDLQGSSALTDEELSQVQAGYFNGSSIAPNSEGIYPQGVFHVGTDLPAGTYWFSGSSSALSYFFILKPTSDGASTYNAVHVNSYFGHNLMNLEDGEVLILANNGTMTPIAKMTEQFSSPYGSGVYRVGTDIPAGSYRVIVGDGADTYSAYYVMSDLNYSDDSYLDSDYFVSGDNGTEIILEEGTYVELYNMRLVAIRS